MRREKEIRKLLGDRFHLMIEYTENWETEQWVLFKKYENCDPIYWSKDNKAILSSDKNTVDELYQFAQAHHKIDYFKTNNIVRTILIIVIFLISIINIFLENEPISILVLVSDLWYFIWLIVDWIILGKNYKVDFLEARENIKRGRNNNE